MKIKKKDIAKLANISNLTFNEQELQAIAHSFDELFVFLEPLTKVSEHAFACSVGEALLREDEPNAQFSREELLFNPKTTDDGFITVPLVMEDV